MSESRTAIVLRSSYLPLQNVPFPLRTWLGFPARLICRVGLEDLGVREIRIQRSACIVHAFGLIDAGLRKGGCDLGSLYRRVPRFHPCSADFESSTPTIHQVALNDFELTPFISFHFRAIQHLDSLDARQRLAQTIL